MGKKPPWDVFQSTGKYILVFIDTGRRKKNVVRLQECLNHYEQYGYKLHSFTTTEWQLGNAAHYVVFEKA